MAHTGHPAARVAHGAHDAHDIKAHVRTYMMVFGALMVLTLVTVAVSYLDMPRLPAVTVALLIASFKAALVAMFFMHLKGERRIIYWSLYLTAVFFVMLFALPMWTEGDHIIGTRPDAWSAGADAPKMPEHSPAVPH
jgi:cytochrome c oxidase subunit 4